MHANKTPSSRCGKPVRTSDLPVLLISLFSLIFICSIRADTIVKKDGRRIEGHVVRETAAEITIQRGGAEITLKRADIQSIERDPLYLNHLKLGQTLFDAGNYSDALHEFEQALLTKPPEVDPKPIQSKIATAQTMLAKQTTAKRQQQLQTINQLLNKATELVDSAQYQRALDMLKETEQYDPSDSQRLAIKTLKADALYGMAYSYYDRMDQGSALEVLQKLFEVDPTHEDGLDLYKRIIERTPVESPEAITEIEQILQKNPERYDLQAQAGEYYYRKREFDKALPFLLAAAKSDLYLARVRGKLRRALLEAVQQDVQNKDFDKAIETYQTYLQYFPDGDKNYLNQLIYTRQDMKLALDDLDGRMALAQQCKMAGYDEWAKEQMERVLRQNPNHPAAQAMRRQFAEEALQEAMDAASEQDLAIAKNKLYRFIETYDYEDLIEKAKTKLFDIERQLREQARVAKERARRLVERGDQYYAVAQHYIDYLQQFRFYERQPYTVRAISQRDTIVLNLKRAIEAWQAALDLDPSLGPVEGGGVYDKLNDARELYRRFTSSKLPRREPWLSRR